MLPKQTKIFWPKLNSSSIGLKIDFFSSENISNRVMAYQSCTEHSNRKGLSDIGGFSLPEPLCEGI
jgi:hypothetical protein